MSPTTARKAVSMILHDELTPELADILGRPTFTVSKIAHLMVKANDMKIAPKAEAEQAAVLFRFLGFYAEHGADWHKPAGEWINAMLECVRAQAA